MVQATQLQLPPHLEAERQKILAAQQFLLQAGAMTLLNAALAQLGTDDLVDVLMGRRMLSTSDTVPINMPAPEIRMGESSAAFMEKFHAACKAAVVKQQIEATLPEEVA